MHKSTNKVDHEILVFFMNKKYKCNRSLKTSKKIQE